MSDSGCGFGDSFDLSTNTGSEPVGALSLPLMPLTDDPPTLGEVLANEDLFNRCLERLCQQDAGASLLFLKQLSLFSLMRRPRAEQVREALRIIWTYLFPGAPSLVRVGGGTVAQLARVCFDLDGARLVDTHLFDAAGAEVEAAVRPLVRAWLDEGVWQSVEFRHFAPPPFSVVLETDSLCAQLRTYLAARVQREAGHRAGASGNDSAEDNEGAGETGQDEEGDEEDDKDEDRDRGNRSGGSSGAAHVAALLQFCLEAQELRDVLIYQDFATRQASLQEGSEPLHYEPSAVPRRPAVLDRVPCPDTDTLAREVYRRHRRLVGIAHQKGMHLAGVLSALDRTIDEFNRGAYRAYNDWVCQRAWARDASYRYKVLQQTKTPEGYVAVPTLAAVLTSSTLFRMYASLLRGSRRAELKFLQAAAQYEMRFRRELGAAAGSTPPSPVQISVALAAPGHTSRSSNVAATVCDMRTEARRIFERFFEAEKTAATSSLGNTATGGMGSSGSGGNSSSGSIDTPTGGGGIGSSTGALPNTTTTATNGETGTEARNVFLSETLRKELEESVRKRPTADTFNRAGAFVYQCALRSWFRECTSTYAWLDKEYNNVSSTARHIEHIFRAEQIAGIDLELVPSPDDVVANPELFRSFSACVPPDIAGPVFAVYREVDRFQQCPPEDSVAQAKAIIAHFSTIVDMFPLLKQSTAHTLEHLAGRRTVSPRIFAFGQRYIMSAVLQQYYPGWVTTTDVYWHVPWQPATEIRFHQLASVTLLPAMLQNIAADERRGFLAKFFADLKRRSSRGRAHHRDKGSSSSSGNSSKHRSRLGSTHLARAHSLKSLDISEALVPQMEVCHAAAMKTAMFQSPLRPRGSTDAFTPPTLAAASPLSCGELSPVESASTASLPLPATATATPRTARTAPSTMPPPALRAHSQTIGAPPPLSSSSSSSQQVQMQQQQVQQVQHPDRFALLLQTIPTLEDTMESCHLRNVFATRYLTLRCNDDEEALWRTLDTFHSRYARVPDDEILAAQDEMRRAAQDIVAAHAAHFRDPALLAKRLADGGFVSGAFFRKEELRIYRRHYCSYVTLLEKKGWQASTPAATATTTVPAAAASTGTLPSGLN